MKDRKLKVSNVGDFYKREEIPQLKLQGKWLREAGIEAYASVSVSVPENGTLVIKTINTP
jgi:hypothetical protein